jgi:hypothetical protein
MDGWMDSLGFLLFPTNLTCSKKIILVEDLKLKIIIIIIIIIACSQ